MPVNAKIRRETRYAFACIGMMALSFAAFAAFMLLPLGLKPSVQITGIRLSLYALLLFVLLGGVFSVRVAALRKKSGK